MPLAAGEGRLLLPPCASTHYAALGDKGASDGHASHAGRPWLTRIAFGDVINYGRGVSSRISP